MKMMPIGKTECGSQRKTNEQGIKRIERVNNKARGSQKPCQIPIGKHTKSPTC